MTKKYQFFISSTFMDLSEERQKVMQAVLESNNIPIGMEYFAASPQKQYEYIKPQIEDCDYCIVIVGGKYGTINQEDKDRRSYSEMEYDFAIEKNIPTIAFVVGNNVRLTSDKIDVDDSEKRSKRDAFIKKISNNMIQYYVNKDDLKAKVLIGISKIIIDFPRVGWIKGEEKIKYNEYKDIDVTFITDNELISIPYYCSDGAYERQHYTINLLNNNTPYIHYSKVAWKDIYSTIAEKIYCADSIRTDDIIKRINCLVREIEGIKSDLSIIDTFYVENSTISKKIIGKLESVGCLSFSNDNGWRLTENGRLLYLSL